MRAPAGEGADMGDGDSPGARGAIQFADGYSRRVRRIVRDTGGKHTVSTVPNVAFNGYAIAVDDAGNLRTIDISGTAIVRTTLGGRRDILVGTPGLSGFTAGMLPGVIAWFPSGLAARAGRLVLTMERTIVEAAPFP